MTKQEALNWWENLTDKQRDDVERFFGYSGHDIGTTEGDIIEFYKNKHLPEVRRIENNRGWIKIEIW